MKDTKNKNVKISEHLKLIVGKKEDSTYADITDIFTWYFNDVIGLPKPYDPKKGGEDDGLPI